VVYTRRMLTETRKGEVAAFSSAFLWSAFPVLTVVTVSQLAPLFTAAIATLIAAVFFALVLTRRKRWGELLLRTAWFDMAMATLFIGIVFYGLTFTGFRFTTPGNGAVVGQMEIFFTFLIVNILWKHERFVPAHAAGALLMVIGALFILLPKWSGRLNAGDLIILIATMAPPVGNVYAQRARRAVSGETLMFVRSAAGCIFLFLLAFLFEPVPPAAALTGAWWLLALNGVFLLGISKLLWLEALHRLPISKTLGLTACGVFMTFVFAYVFLHQNVTMQQLLSAVPMIAGLVLLTRKEG
ncbi:MAG TPA: DMT family transporter, partial [Candidatus Peribacteria bacterium]|nr:DMT family transporter [Candidatus Peribacteria bacterium]